MQSYSAIREEGAFFDRMLDDNNDLDGSAGSSLSKPDRRSSGSGWYSSRKMHEASSLSSSPPLPQRGASSPILPQLRNAGRRLSWGNPSPRADRRSRESQESVVTPKGGYISPKRVGITGDGPQAPAQGERIGNYTVVRMIGQGGEGSIYLVVHEESGRDGELILKRRVFLSFADGNEGLQEVLAMAKVRSPFCVSLTNVFQVDLNAGSFALCLVMEYCPNGDLLRKLVRIMDGKEPKLTPQQVKLILYDLIRGLAAIHEAGFTHRDIKLENILLDQNDRAKIGDFGLAYPALRNLKGCVGSSQYASPEMEVDRNQGYSCAVDLWALGVVALELAAGYVWRSNHRADSLGMVAAADIDFDPSKWVDSELSLDMRHEVGPLIVLLLQRDPKRRFDEAEVVDAIEIGHPSVSLLIRRENQKTTITPAVQDGTCISNKYANVAHGLSLVDDDMLREVLLRVLMDVDHDDAFPPGRGLAKKASATLPQGATGPRAQIASSSTTPSIKRTLHGGQRRSARSLSSLPATPPEQRKSVFGRASLGTLAEAESGDSLDARIDCMMGGKSMSAALRKGNVESAMRELVKGPWMVSARKIAKEGRLVHVCSGPITKDTEEPQLLTTLDDQIIEELAARSISTYPMGPCGKIRDGSPIGDGYLARLRGTTAILCVTDGCGWGARSREASIKAKCGFVEYLDTHIDKCIKCPDIAATLFRALAAAHCKIIEGKDESSNVGTTTLLGGYVVPLRSTEAFLFISVSVGDCKAYLRKGLAGKIVDLTCDSRSQNRDAKDPGGRIGAYEADRSPDLRNLSLNYCVCERGDMLILASDGVSDNLDPAFLGETVGDPVANKLEWSCQKIEALLGSAAPKNFLRPVAVVNSLLSHCVTVTQASRDWHESGQLDRVPEDYIKFPGKMDHSTCMCLMFRQ